MTFAGNEKLRTGACGFIALLLMISVLFSMSAISCFAADAEAEFISSVQRLEELSGLEWAQSVENATQKWEAYVQVGGSADANATVAAAYAVYAAEKAIYDACETFMNNSYEISDPGFERYGYEYMAQILDESNGIFVQYKDENKFRGYGGVGAAITEFSAVYEEFTRQRDYCQRSVTNAALAANATTYADAKRYSDLAAQAKKLIDVEGYPGMEEAEEQLDDAKSFISSIMNAAIPFITAVQDIEYAEDERTAIIAALNVYKTVDSTADGVTGAYQDLLAIIRVYNAKINAANEASRGAFGMSVGAIP